ncbi:uncharacterized protein LOC119437417 [Dermacentor silvarum]|uniref:uncharacterized protein LOC119437417 n=1 Tax=Dermacentor silvarum TaxID=543639 RepID=UPI001898E08F|nr:uncharacterized protein LOC119437417 [Dermacentor silvarum]
MMAEVDPDWAPSLHLRHGKKESSEKSVARYRRKLNCSMRASNPLTDIQMATSDTDDDAEQPTIGGTPSEEQNIQHEKPPIKFCARSDVAEFSQNTDLTMADIALMEEENKHLSKLVDAKDAFGTHLLTEDVLRQKEDMLQFYTGLPSFPISYVLFELLKGSVSHNSRNCLTQFQEMLIFLMRLRLNLPLQDLAYR